MYKTEGEWTPCFDTGGVKIPSVAYLGFSAATGDLSDNFDIIGMETRNLYSTGGSTGRTQGSSSGSGSKPASSSYQEGTNEGGSWSWFFLKIILFIMVVAGGYVGYTMYRSQQRQSRF